MKPIDCLVAEPLEEDTTMVEFKRCIKAYPAAEVERMVELIQECREAFYRHGIEKELRKKIQHVLNEVKK